MKKQVSIRDVAHEAGVSAATVSYVLNQTPNITISPETTIKVREAAERLKYVPSQAAKTLGSSRLKRSSRSNLIGIVIPQTEQNKYFMFSNPFYGDFLSAVEYEARKNGYHILISGVNADQSYVEIAKARSLDGIVIVGMYPSKDIEEYKKSGIPAVLVDCYCNNDHFFHSVRTDDRYGGYMATDYLVQKGHRNIAIVSGEIRENGVNNMRFLGYQDALLEANIAYNASLVYDGYVGFQYGLEAADKIVNENKKRKDKITAVFATSDIVAVGVIKGFQERGMRVPEDYSVIGFDDVYYSQICNPSLTTIHQNIIEKGREAAKIMISAAVNPGLPKRERIIPMELVERQSVRSLTE